MHQKSARWIAWLIILATCVSFLALPGLAAEETEAAPEVQEEIAPPQEETPLVNVIEVPEPAEEPEPEEEPEPIEEPDPVEEPEPTEEPDPVEEPEPTEEPDPAETPEPTEEPDPAEETDPTDEPSGEPDTDGDTPGASEEPQSFTVSYYNGETLLSQETVAKGAAPAAAPTEAGGRSIRAWTDSEGKLADLTKLQLEADASFYAWFIPQLKTASHDRYINGVGDNKFAPTNTLTRAQAATILYNLLDSTAFGPYNSTFTDVADASWYGPAVKTLASFGVINGYADGSFKPNGSVTRAEFVTMLVRLIGVSGGSASFTDVSGHWALASIQAAAGMGWINGYAQDNGTYAFKPNNSITRAEAVVVMNRVLGRSADRNVLAAGVGIMSYDDVKNTDWWYADVMEASIAHTYSRTSGGEVWNDYDKVDSGMEPGLQKLGDQTVFVDQNRQLVTMRPGVNIAGGNYYYAKAQGFAIDADLSVKPGYAVFTDGSADQALADGFNLIGTTLFYWNGEEKTPRYLNEGLNVISGKTYWADQAGYNIRNNFGRGVVSLGGKNYLSDGACAIITSGEGYTSATSRPTTIDLKDQTFEFDGQMYYVQSDYSLATDTWKGYLYFGTNCAYTSSDATLDAYVYDVVKTFIGNNALTKEQKLLKAYYYFRGGEGENWVDSGFRYMPSPKGYKYARYNGQQHYSWSIDCANFFFSHKYGICYDWAAVMLYCARRLGFQSYLCVGNIYYDITADRHCWPLIQWDGKWHICDLNNEWGHLAGYYPTAKLYWNLFGQTLSSENVSTYRNPECGIKYYFK